jgi:hypothetical protein
VLLCLFLSWDRQVLYGTWCSPRPPRSTTACSSYETTAGYCNYSPRLVECRCSLGKAWLDWTQPCFRHQRHSNSLDRHQRGGPIHALRNPRQGVLPCVTACPAAKLSLQANASVTCSLAHSPTSPPSRTRTYTNARPFTCVTAGSFSIVPSPVARTTHPQPNHPHLPPTASARPTRPHKRHSTWRSPHIANHVPFIVRSLESRKTAHL